MREHKGYKIRQAYPTGGKAGKGLNKTSTIQVFKEGNALGIPSFFKQIRYNVGESESKFIAIKKAFVAIEEDLGNHEEAERLRRLWNIKTRKNQGKESS